MTTFNGHRNWNHWNVSLWVNNDEGFYRQAKRCIRATKNRKDAAVMLLEFLHVSGVKETEDGAPFSISSLQAALMGM